jgi:hypothetical protein
MRFDPEPVTALAEEMTFRLAVLISLAKEVGL